MRFARVYLKGSDCPLRWVDWPLNGDISLGHWVTMARMQGGLFPEGNLAVFIPFDEIKFIIEISSEVSQSRLFVMPNDGKPN